MNSQPFYQDSLHNPYISPPPPPSPPSSLMESSVGDILFPPGLNYPSCAPIIVDVCNDPPYGEYIGYCKWFNNKLGYGFIRVCTGDIKRSDIFVHHSGLKPLNSSFKTMYKGEYINFNIIDGRNGKQAVDVTGILGGPLMCDNVTTRVPSFSSYIPHPHPPPPPPSSSSYSYSYSYPYSSYSHSSPSHSPPPPPPPGLSFLVSSRF